VNFVSYFGNNMLIMFCRWSLQRWKRIQRCAVWICVWI